MRTLALAILAVLLLPTTTATPNGGAYAPTLNVVVSGGAAWPLNKCFYVAPNPPPAPPEWGIVDCPGSAESLANTEPGAGAFICIDVSGRNFTAASYCHSISA